jgi:hypothetical protein
MRDRTNMMQEMAAAMMARRKIQAGPSKDPSFQPPTWLSRRVHETTRNVPAAHM